MTAPALRAQHRHGPGPRGTHRPPTTRGNTTPEPRRGYAVLERGDVE